MSSSRLSQAATSAGIVGVAAVALFFGVQVVLFNADVARVEADAAASSGSRSGGENAVGHGGGAGRWSRRGRGARRLAGDARRRERGAGDDRGAGRGLARRSACSRSRARLSVAPTNGAQWLAFADATLRLGYGADHALRAYDMATLTARREGDQMYARALLVLGSGSRCRTTGGRRRWGSFRDVRWQLNEPEFKTIAAIVAAKTRKRAQRWQRRYPPKLRGDKRLMGRIGL